MFNTYSFLRALCPAFLSRTISDLVAKEAEQKVKKSGQPVVKKVKPKMGLMDSFRYLMQSSYLGYIAILVIAYGLSINFTEVGIFRCSLSYLRLCGLDR